MPLDSAAKDKFLLSEIYNNRANAVIFTGAAENLLSTIPADTINLIVGSPPYNLGKEYERSVDIEDYKQEQKSVLAELHRVLKPNGSICWQVGNYVKDNQVLPLDFIYYDLFKELGMYLRNRIVWRFGHGLNSKKRFSGRYETLLWLTKGHDYKFNLDPVRIRAKYPNKRYSKGEKKGQLSGNPKGTNPSDVWDIILKDWESGFWEIPNVKSNHCEKTIHPCQFPIELVERCVLALTDEDDTVLDPFMGVGTSIIAAIMHDRKAIGSDKEKKYADVAKERVKAYLESKLKIRPIGKPVFNPEFAGKVADIPDAWRNDKESIYYQPGS